MRGPPSSQGRPRRTRPSAGQAGSAKRPAPKQKAQQSISRSRNVGGHEPLWVIPRPRIIDGRTAIDGQRAKGVCIPRTLHVWHGHIGHPGRRPVRGDRLGEVAPAGPAGFATATFPTVACDPWGRSISDFAILRKFGLNAHRFSIEWAQVEPSPGKFDHTAIDRYRAMLGALLDAGIAPLVTLHHFSIPRWLSEHSGLLSGDLTERLTGYTVEVVRALKDLCRWWITINEPSVVMTQGYLLGTWPPGERWLPSAVRVQNNLLAAHVSMYRAIHELRARRRSGPGSPYESRRSRSAASPGRSNRGCAGVLGLGSLHAGHL